MMTDVERSWAHDLELMFHLRAKRDIMYIHILIFIVCMRAKSLQSYLTPCDPMDHSRPDSSVHGILPARIQEWTFVCVRMCT